MSSASLLYRWGLWAAQNKGRVIGAWVIGFAILAGTAITFRGEFSDAFSNPGSDSQKAYDLLAARFPAQSGDTAQIVFQAGTGINDATVRGEIQTLLDTVATLPHVASIDSPLTNPANVSADGTIAFATVQYDLPAQDIAKADLEKLVHVSEAANSATLTIEPGGTIVAQIEQEPPGGETFIALIASAVVLLIAFGSIIAMGLPLVTALAGLGSGFMFVFLVTRVMDIASFTPTIAAMVGLGVGIDYALFIVTRYRESLHSGMTVNQSVAKSMDTSGRAVLFAGIVVVIAMLGLVAIGLPFITAYAIAASLVITLTITSALTLLPALLALTGKRIDKWGIKRFQVTAADHEDTVGAKLGRRIQKNPWVFAIASAGLLIVLALPAFSVKLGFNDAGASPTTMHTRRAYDLLEKGFGPGFNAPFLIAIEQPGGLDPALLDKLEAQLKFTEGIVFVAPPTLNEAGDTAVITIVPAYRLTDSKAADLVDKIRKDILPPITKGTTANAHVGGVTASFIDVVEVMVSRTPYFFLIVVGLSFLLLATVFRSIAIAIKAAIMNLLSIGAAFGVLVAAFQWGWLRPILGGSDGQPIIAFMPMFLFSILFGLSMDYEVFLLSRIREAWVHGKSTPDAVVEGLGVTARVITAAAAIMIVVFLSFVFIPDPITRQFGVGLATAIFLDATIVRLILVPATMELLGDWNWWFPSWLDRILPRLNVEGSAPEVAIEAAAD